MFLSRVGISSLTRVSCFSFIARYTFLTASVLSFFCFSGAKKSSEMPNFRGSSKFKRSDCDTPQQPTLIQRRTSRTSRTSCSSRSSRSSKRRFVHLDRLVILVLEGLHVFENTPNHLVDRFQQNVHRVLLVLSLLLLSGTQRGGAQSLLRLSLEDNLFAQVFSADGKLRIHGTKTFVTTGHIWIQAILDLHTLRESDLKIESCVLGFWNYIACPKRQINDFLLLTDRS